MADRYMFVTVEYGHIEYDEEGNSIVMGDQSDTYDMSDSSASFVDIFDDLAFEARVNLQ